MTTEKSAKAKAAPKAADPFEGYPSLQRFNEIQDAYAVVVDFISQGLPELGISLWDESRDDAVYDPASVIAERYFEIDSSELYRERLAFIEKASRRATPEVKEG